MQMVHVTTRGACCGSPGAVRRAAPALAQAQSSRPTVAVLDLDYGTIQRWWEANWDVGKGVADLIVDELVNDGSFRIIERKRLDALLAEQNFSNSDRADPTPQTVAQDGQDARREVPDRRLAHQVRHREQEGRRRRRRLGRRRLRPRQGRHVEGQGHGRDHRPASSTRRPARSSPAPRARARPRAAACCSAVAAAAGAAAVAARSSMGSSDFRETILGEATEKRGEGRRREARGRQEPARLGLTPSGRRRPREEADAVVVSAAEDGV